MSRDRSKQKLADIDQVRGSIEQWRQGGRQGRAMPGELWSAAVDLVASHGVYAVSRQLGVGYGKLKALVEESREKMPRVTEAVGFVELCASDLFGAPGPVGSAVVEIVAEDGARLRVSVSGPGVIDVAALVSAFRGRRGERCCR